jgi:hypothetical protein
MAGNLSQEEEIKRYLFRELPREEMERFEERLFEDGDYFYDVLGLEDDLVARYALGKLSGAELERFERSLRASPARREKVADAVALQRRIAEERRAVAAGEAAARAARTTFWQRLAGLFGPQTPALRYAAVGLLVLLTFGLVFLATERFRLGRELARLREGRDSESRQREEDLRRQVAAAVEHEAELKRQIEGERGRSQVLDEQLEGESAERERLQRELERLRHERGDAATPAAFASAFLVPSGRGSGKPGEVIVGKNVGRIAIGLELEDGLNPEGRFNVEVNGRAVATGLRPRRMASGRLLVTVVVSPQNVTEGLNRIAVRNENNLPVGDYELNVRRR